MADDPNERGPRDATRINRHEDYEVRYWTKKYGVTKEQLFACIDKVGVMAKDVEKCLGK